MLRSLVPAIVCLALPAQTPLRVAAEPPRTLDLRQDQAADWVPRDARDPAQAEAAHQAWSRRLEEFRGAPTYRPAITFAEAISPNWPAGLRTFYSQFPK